MRVAVANWSSRLVGGVEEYVCLVIPALQRAGAEVAFWHECDEPANRHRIERRKNVVEFCAADMGLDAALNALRAWKPDCIYVQALKSVKAEAELLDIAPAVFFLHTYTGTCISGGKTWTRPTPVACSRRFGWPCLVHYFPHGCGGNNPITMWRLYQEQHERLSLLRRYRTILTHTEHMRHEMLNNGLDAQVVAFPVEVPSGGDVRAADGALRLLFVARMEILKGGHLLIDAMPAVMASARRPIRVVMAGDGVERPRWEARARNVQQATPGLTFEFPGWLSRHQVDALMKNSDVLVVPSIWPEPFGAVGPAAAQHGLPAAAFAVGGIPQWLVDGVTGHHAPGNPPTPQGLARAIVQCVEDPRHYEALRAGAAQMAGTFTMTRHLPQLMRALEGKSGA